MQANFTAAVATVLVALFESRHEVDHIVVCGFTIEIEWQTALDFVDRDDLSHVAVVVNA